MSIQIVRLVADQAPPFTMAGQYRFTATVPGSIGFTDMQHSSLVLQTGIDIVDNTGAELLLPPSFTGWTKADNAGFKQVAPVGPQALIRQVETFSKTGGSASRRTLMWQNVMASTLDWYTRTRSGQSIDCDLGRAGANNHYGEVGESGLPDQPFLIYSRPKTFGTAETVPSEKRVAELHISMDHLDSMATCGAAQQFPNILFGDTTYFIELENVINVTCPAPMPKDIDFSEGVLSASGFIGVSGNPIIMDQTYKTIESFNNIPLYVGAPLFLEMDISGADYSLNTVVTSLMVADSTTGQLQMVVSPPVFGVSMGAVTLGIVRYRGDVNASTAADIPPWTATWSVINAWLEMHKLVLSPKELESARRGLQSLVIPWMDRQIYVDNMPTLQQLQQVEAPPVGVAGVAVCTPQIGQLVSGGDSCDAYRFFINGKATTNQRISVGPVGNVDDQVVPRQIHNYRLMQFFANLGMSLKKFDAAVEDYNTYDNECDRIFFPQLIPVSTDPIRFQIDLDSSSAMTGKSIYYQYYIPKVVRIQGERIVN